MRRTEVDDFCMLVVQMADYHPSVRDAMAENTWGERRASVRAARDLLAAVGPRLARHHADA